MSYFFMSLIIFCLAGVGLAIGYIIKGKALKGSCGGLNNLYSKDGRSHCEICGANGTDKEFCK